MKAGAAVRSDSVTRNGHRRAHPHEAFEGWAASRCRGAPDRGLRSRLPGPGGRRV